VVRPSAFAMRAVRPPKGTVRPPVVVIGVPALRSVLMGKSTICISDKNL
jgi:hypothetical protein